MATSIIDLSAAHCSVSPFNSIALIAWQPGRLELPCEARFDHEVLWLSPTLDDASLLPFGKHQKQKAESH